MTHDELVERAVKWLMSGVKVANRSTTTDPSVRFSASKVICDVIMTHKTIAIGEEPDAIGWSASRSILVECKASRGDFLRDGKKHFRQYPKNGVGQYRYYMTPKGLVTPDEIPEHWGLAEVCGKVVRVKKLAVQQEFHQHNERRLLLHLLRRSRQRVATD